MTNTNTFNTTQTSNPTFQTYPWDQINTPGTYVCNWSGHLLRVPNEYCSTNSCPPINIVGSEPLYVTKISADPYLSISKARLAASNLDIEVNF